MSFSKDNFISDNARYERRMIGKLQNERELIQEKTYKNWINSILIQGRTGINDIYTDFQSGEKLIILLRLLTGEKVGQVNKSSTLLHKIANVSQCLKFIKSKDVYLESIGPDDIVNGNKKLTLGLIWTLILRFQLSKHLDFLVCDLKLIKESLLLWCQNRTKHLQVVEIVDFTKSWQDGWAFIALVHSFRPESIEIESLRKKENRELMSIAFDTAYQQMLIPKILDIDDVLVAPDENSILTYVSYFYNMHSKAKSSETSVKRVKYLLTHISGIENMQDTYLNNCQILLIWINEKVNLFQKDIDVSRAPDENLEFNNYFFNERPEKLISRNDCANLFFEIASTRKEAGLRPFNPGNGFTIKDLEKAWLNLEQIEKDRQSKLRLLINQHGKLSRQAELFNLKSRKFESYVTSKLELLNKIFNFERTNSKKDLENHLRQSEAICHDILSNNVRFDSLINLANQLIDQKHGDIQFYTQYKSHITEKLSKLHELSSSNLLMIETCRRLFVHLIYTENLSQELEELYQQLNLLIIVHDQVDCVQNIVLNLEKLKHFEIYLDVLKERYLSSRDEFDMMMNNEKSKQSSIILDIETYEKKLDDSVEYIDLCRNIIESNKNSLNHQLDINDFMANMECICQFLSEKQIITNTNPDECCNSSSIHFIQRRNNIIKLETKVTEKELYSACKKGYSLVDDEHPKISELICSTIETTKIKFKNFIFIINERTLLINESMRLFNLLNELVEHETLIKNLDGNSQENLGEKLSLYRDDLIYLADIFDRLDKLSIRMLKKDSDNQTNLYIVYLNNYQLEQIDFSLPSHVYLVFEIDQLPNIQLDKFWIMHSNLFQFIKSKIDHVKQLLILTECDLDTNKLKQMLDVNGEPRDYSKQSYNLIEHIDDRIKTEEIDTIFKVFFDKENSEEFCKLLKDRKHFVFYDFSNIKELLLIIKHTMKLIETTKNIMDLCQKNEVETIASPIVELDRVIHENDHQLNVNDEPFAESEELIENYSRIDSMDKQVQNSILPESDYLDEMEEITQMDDIEPPVSDEEFNEKINKLDVKKKKLFVYKLRNDMIFIYQYFVDINQENYKHKIDFLGKIINDNVKRIDIYIVEYPEDPSIQEIQEISNELLKLNEKLTHYQKLCHFKDLLDDFNLNLTNNLDQLDCLKPNCQVTQENSVRNDLRVIKSIEVLYIYYHDLFDEFDENVNDDEPEIKQHLEELRFIFDRYKKAVESTKKFLSHRLSCIENEKRKERINLLMKRYEIPTVIQHESRQKEILSSDFHGNVVSNNKAKEIVPIEKENLFERGTAVAKDNDDNVQNVLREMELALFDLGCETNHTKYKQEHLENLFSDALELSHCDTEIVDQVNKYKKIMDQTLSKLNCDNESKHFESSSKHFLECLHDIDSINELMNNVDHLPMDEINKKIFAEKLNLFQLNYVHYKSLLNFILKDHRDSGQTEIRSKLVYLQDCLKKLAKKIDDMKLFLEINEDFATASTVIEYIVTIIQEDDIEVAVLKNLQSKTHEIQQLIEQISTSPINNGHKSVTKELHHVQRLNSLISLKIRYRILKLLFDDKVKNFENRQCAKDDEFKQFLCDMQHQKDLIENVLSNINSNHNDNHKILDDILNNWSTLLKKFDSFSYLLEVDSFRKDLEMIEPTHDFEHNDKKQLDNRQDYSPEKSSNQFDQPSIELPEISNMQSSKDRILSYDSIIQDTSSISSDDIINNNVRVIDNNATEYSTGSQTSFYYSENDVSSKIDMNDNQPQPLDDFIKSSTPIIDSTNSLNNVEKKLDFEKSADPLHHLTEKTVLNKITAYTLNNPLDEEIFSLKGSPIQLGDENYPPDSKEKVKGNHFDIGKSKNNENFHDATIANVEHITRNASQVEPNYPPKETSAMFVDTKPINLANNFDGVGERNAHSFEKNSLESVNSIHQNIKKEKGLDPSNYEMQTNQKISKDFDRMNEPSSHTMPHSSQIDSSTNDPLSQANISINNEMFAGSKKSKKKKSKKKNISTGNDESFPVLPFQNPSMQLSNSNKDNPLSDTVKSSGDESILNLIQSSNTSKECMPTTNSNTIPSKIIDLNAIKSIWNKEEVLKNNSGEFPTHLFHPETNSIIDKNSRSWFLDYITPQNSPHIDAPGSPDFASLINWEEIENVKCPTASSYSIIVKNQESTNSNKLNGEKVLNEQEKFESIPLPNSKSNDSTKDLTLGVSIPNQSENGHFIVPSEIKMAKYNPMSNKNQGNINELTEIDRNPDDKHQLDDLISNMNMMKQDSKESKTDSLESEKINDSFLISLPNSVKKMLSNIKGNSESNEIQKLPPNNIIESISEKDNNSQFNNFKELNDNPIDLQNDSNNPTSAFSSCPQNANSIQQNSGKNFLKQEIHNVLPNDDKNLSSKKSKKKKSKPNKKSKDKHLKSTLPDSNEPDQKVTESGNKESVPENNEKEEDKKIIQLFTDVFDNSQDSNKIFLEKNNYFQTQQVETMFGMHEKQEKPKKIIRIILRDSNGEESEQNIELDPEAEPEDVDKTIEEALESKILKSSKPGDKIIVVIIDLNDDDEENIEEFETDSETAKKNLKDVIKKTPRTKTSKKKDSFGRIKTRIFKKSPEGEEIIEEFVEDPEIPELIDETNSMLSENVHGRMSKKKKSKSNKMRKTHNNIEEISGKLFSQNKNNSNPKNHEPKPQDIIDFSKILTPSDEKSSSEVCRWPTNLVENQVNVNDRIENCEKTEFNDETDIIIECAEDLKSLEKLKDINPDVIEIIYETQPSLHDNKNAKIQKNQLGFKINDPNQILKLLDDKKVVGDFDKDSRVTRTGESDDYHLKPIHTTMIGMPEELKNPKKTLKIILRKPDGEESEQNIELDPEAKPEDIDEAIKKALKSSTLKSSQPGDKIVIITLDMRPSEYNIEEFETDPETAMENIEDLIKKAPRIKTTKKIDPLGRILTRIIQKSPNDEEIIEEFAEDPRIAGTSGYDDYPFDPSDNTTMKGMPKEQKKPKKIIRIILRKPSGEESEQNIELDPEAEPEDVDKTIEEVLKSKILKSSKPGDKIIVVIIDLNDDDEENIEEFETDSETAKKNLKDVIKKTRTKTSKKKDSFGRIKTRIFKKSPKGEEFSQDLETPELIDETNSMLSENVHDLISKKKKPKSTNSLENRIPDQDGIENFTKSDRQKNEKTELDSPTDIIIECAEDLKSLEILKDLNPDEIIFEAQLSRNDDEKNSGKLNKFESPVDVYLKEMEALSNDKIEENPGGISDLKENKEIISLKGNKALIDYKVNDVNESLDDVNQLIGNKKELYSKNKINFKHRFDKTSMNISDRIDTSEIRHDDNTSDDGQIESERVITYIIDLRHSQDSNSTVPLKTSDDENSILFHHQSEEEGEIDESSLGQITPTSDYSIENSEHPESISSDEHSDKLDDLEKRVDLLVEKIRIIIEKIESYQKNQTKIVKPEENSMEYEIEIIKSNEEDFPELDKETYRNSEEIISPKAISDINQKWKEECDQKNDPFTNHFSKQIDERMNAATDGSCWYDVIPQRKSDTSISDSSSFMNCDVTENTDCLSTDNSNQNIFSSKDSTMDPQKNLVEPDSMLHEIQHSHSMPNVPTNLSGEMDSSKVKKRKSTKITKIIRFSPSRSASFSRTRSLDNDSTIPEEYQQKPSVYETSNMVEIRDNVSSDPVPEIEETESNEVAESCSNGSTIKSEPIVKTTRIIRKNSSGYNKEKRQSEVDLIYIIDIKHDEEPNLQPEIEDNVQISSQENLEPSSYQEESDEDFNLNENRSFEDYGEPKQDPGDNFTSAFDDDHIQPESISSNVNHGDKTDTFAVKKKSTKKSKKRFHSPVKMADATMAHVSEETITSEKSLEHIDQEEPAKKIDVQIPLDQIEKSLNRETSDQDLDDDYSFPLKLDDNQDQISNLMNFSNYPDQESQIKEINDNKSGSFGDIPIKENSMADSDYHEPTGSSLPRFKDENKGIDSSSSSSIEERSEEDQSQPVTDEKIRSQEISPSYARSIKKQLNLEDNDRTKPKVKILKFKRKTRKQWNKKHGIIQDDDSSEDFVSIPVKIKEEPKYDSDSDSDSIGQTYSSDSFMKRFGRIIKYALPFYLLFLLMFLILLWLPKDEDEFNCLRRNGEYASELKKVYVNGPPPV